MTDKPKRPKRTTARGATTPDPIELAMEAAAEGREPSGPVRTLLENQNRLIGWQIATERAGFGLKLLTGFVGVVAAVVVATVLISASQYRGLTVQPFSVPPELEARGLNGSAVATRVLDKLTALQAGTVSLRAANSYANSWGDSVEVQIPQTGVSAGELWKFLRSWLGEEVKITGEVVRVGTGLQVTTRAGGQAAAPLLGEEAELEALLDRAAEAIFAETQPYRYAIHLSRTGRIPESITVLERLSVTGDETDRKWALAAWSLQLQMLGQFEASVAKAEAALAIDPGFGLARANLGGVLGTMGRTEDAYRQNLLTADAMRDDTDMNPDISDAFIQEMEGMVLGAQHDHMAAAARYETAAAADGRSQRGVAFRRAVQLAALHEFGRGRELTRHTSDQSGGTEEVGAAMTPMDRYEAIVCVMAENWPCVVRAAGTYFAEPDSGSPTYAVERHSWLAAQAPMLAYAYARTGDMAEAERLIALSPADLATPVLERAAIAAIRGDVQASERGFAYAARLTPSLADAPYRWGRARLERGDRAGAIAQLSLAAAKAPRWADPLKYWGDALAAGGDHRGAIRKYRDAAQRAPRWGALHLAWGRALDASGRRADAVERYRMAAGMDLSAADQIEARRRAATR